MRLSSLFLVYPFFFAASLNQAVRGKNCDHKVYHVKQRMFSQVFSTCILELSLSCVGCQGITFCLLWDNDYAVTW